MVKKITAPKTYDPGKGRPKEHLAYLNQREMEYLRQINGDNMERGPRGLPSFPPEDAVGSSSKTKSGGGGSRGPGGPSGPNSGPSRGGGLGGGSKGGPSGGSKGAGGRGPGGPSGPNSGPSKASGSPAGSKAGPASKGPSKGPSSPMGGQGTSFSSTKGAASYNKDRAIQQKAQVKDTRNAVRNSPAARNDLSVGGIRTLNVGPMGTPVSVGRQPMKQGAKQFYDRVPQTAQTPKVPSRTAGDLREQYSYYKNQNAPMAPMVGDKLRDYLKVQDQFERDMRELGQGVPGSFGKVTPTGNPIMAGGVRPVSSVKTRGIGDSLAKPRSSYSGASFNPESDIQQMAVDRAIINTNIANSLGPANKPAVASTSGFSITSPAAAATPGSVDLKGAGYGTFNVPDVEKLNFDRKLKDMMTPGREISGPPSPFSDEKILGVENFPDTSVKQRIADESVYSMGLHGYPKEQMLRPGMHYDPAAPEKIKQALDQAATRRMASQPRSEVAGGLGIVGINSPQAEDYFDVSGMTPKQLDRLYNGPTYGKTRGLDAENNVADSSLPSGTEAWENTPYGEPGDIQRPKSKAESYSRFLPSVFGLGSRAGSMAVDAEWKTLDPSERMALMDKWDARRDAYIRNREVGYAGSSSTSAGGGTPDIGSGGKGRPQYPYQRGETIAPPDKATPNESGSRPSIYYKWDLGIDIPSPTDSEYNLYLKYLDEKKAAQA